MDDELGCLCGIMPYFQVTSVGFAFAEHVNVTVLPSWIFRLGSTESDTSGLSVTQKILNI